VYAGATFLGYLAASMYGHDGGAREETIGDKLLWFLIGIAWPITGPACILFVILRGIYRMIFFKIVCRDGYYTIHKRTNPKTIGEGWRLKWAFEDYQNKLRKVRDDRTNQ
jgi:hypothetical protein